MKNKKKFIFCFPFRISLAVFNFLLALPKPTWFCISRTYDARSNFNYCFFLKVNRKYFILFFFFWFCPFRFAFREVVSFLLLTLLSYISRVFCFKFISIKILIWVFDFTSLNFLLILCHLIYSFFFFVIFRLFLFHSFYSYLESEFLFKFLTFVVFQLSCLLCSHLSL